MTEISQFLFLFLILIFLFVTEIIPMAVTALGGAILCGILGFIPAEKIFSGFSNSTVVFLAGMYVIGAALLHSGFASSLANILIKAYGTSAKNSILGLMIVAGLFSAILSNTATAAALLPVALKFSNALKVPPSRFLIPVSFACSLGGLFTLIGSPSNIIENIILGNHSLVKFSFFEFSYIGIPIFIVGIIYMMTVGDRILSQKHEISPLFSGQYCAKKKRNSFMAGSIWFIVVFVLALDLKFLPIHIISSIGALACVVSGCLSDKEAYRSIDWSAILILSGILPIAVSMKNVGIVEWFANWMLYRFDATTSIYFIVAFFFLLSAGVTQFIPSTLSTMILCPIGITFAYQLNLNPQVILMTIVVGSSSAFATPLGAPSNLMMIGYGNYRFYDYLKVGGGLVALSFIISVLMIPLIWMS